MSVEAPSRYRFTPHNSICLAVNVEFGKLDPKIIPDYYQPVDEAKEIASLIVGLAVDTESGVELVFADEIDEATSTFRSEVDRQLYRAGLATIIGPENLQDLVGDVNGPGSFLWPRGEVIDSGDF